MISYWEINSTLNIFKHATINQHMIQSPEAAFKPSKAQWCLSETENCFSPLWEQFPVKVLMHDGQTQLEGSEWLRAWKTGREVGATIDGNGSLQQRDWAPQNKAEQNQHNQNAVITTAWSVIQVNILMLRPTFVTTKAKTTGVQQLHATHNGNVLTIAGLLGQLKLPKPGFKGMCLMLSHYSNV